MKTWTDQIPSIPGWYWRCEGTNCDNAKIQHLNVYTIKDLKAGYRKPEDTRSFMITYHAKHPDLQKKWAEKPLDEYKTWWYGPILPTEVKPKTNKHR